MVALNLLPGRSHRPRHEPQGPADQFQYHIRTFSTTFPDVRTDGINNFDANLQKRFTFAEKRSLQLRIDVFNL